MPIVLCPLTAVCLCTSVHAGRFRGAAGDEGENERAVEPAAAH